MERQSTACFTGHRPSHLQFLNQPKSKEFKLLSNLLDFYIVLLHEKYGVTDFISGMALGVDTLAAERVIAIRDAGIAIRLICALPCPQQDQRWSSTDRERYRRLCKRADEVICVNNEYSDACMINRNKFMVSRSSHCIAVWNGRIGGTSSTVNAAKRDKLHLIHINPNDFSVTEEEGSMQISLFK